MAKYENMRINLVFGFVLLVSCLIGYKLFTLSILKHNLYSQTAEAQHDNISNILARGNIYMQPDLFLVATNKKFPFAYVVPSDIPAENKEEASQQLSDILQIDKQIAESVINSKTSTMKIMARQISTSQIDRIKGLKIKGVGASYEMNRFYPAKETAANVIGFFGYSGDTKSGQYGVESFYDDDLFGKSWRANDYINPANISGLFSLIKKFFLGKSVEKEKIVNTIDRPSDIILTIDKNIQSVVELELDDVMKKWKATGGTVIVQDPNTGQILAMADRPTFDPNNYKDFPTGNFLNRGVQEVFEPGSSYKPITMAMGLDLDKVTAQTTFIDIGYKEIAGYTIRNFSDKVFGLQTMLQVLEKSINTGAMYVQELIGDDNFLNYAINLGFGQKTGIDLPGEVNGDITNLYSGRKINYQTASFGQGIAVTPIQLISAYSAIANNGKLMKPYIVEKIIKEGGEEIITKPEVVSIPLSEKTTTKLKSMLVSVVDNGFDKARIKGYDIAGKTGTAQIPDNKGGYSENEFIHNFLGFAPAYDPKFVILIKMDRPKGITFAADSLSPTFRNIAAFLINYYKIPPTRQ